MKCCLVVAAGELVSVDLMDVLIVTIKNKEKAKALFILARDTCTKAFMLNMLFVAVFSETLGGVQTEHSMKNQEGNECYRKNTIDQTCRSSMADLACSYCLGMSTKTSLGQLLF